ncbi:MAG: DNA-3-methyladenine glycosylase [Phycisphaerales bacterium]|nr:DNA-3-methyladenine glycosylase [Phycisphaerales bacterium]
MRSFFARPADELAPRLLGCRLMRRLEDGTVLGGVIVETEAYLGPEDRAAHSFGGRRTPRTEPMFMAPGTSYVYFTYGMHHCMNVSAMAKEVPHAVLLRALEPTEGLDRMCELRGRPGGRASELCNGPGKLCQALAIDRSLSAVDTCTSEALWFERGRKLSDAAIGCSARVGIGYAGEWVEKPLRWFVLGNSCVSRGPRAHKLSG